MFGVVGGTPGVKEETRRPPTSVSDFRARTGTNRNAPTRGESHGGAGARAVNSAPPRPPSRPVAPGRRGGKLTFRAPESCSLVLTLLCRHVRHV